MVTCLRCGKKGHYSKNCLTERETPVPHGEKSTQPTRVIKRETEAHYGGVNNNYNEREMYTIDNRENLKDPLNNDDNLFDQLVYENEEVKETDEYFTEEMLSEKEDSELYINPWQNA
ncbi:7717_t:CDS:2 [Dentiscutata heterogama]|uniref:7717_t:CDS:1 n=1 Tax=Dentiscutata heterogama TaxID=1316150 RepID=A0ACA9K7T7_9GLOM|nr:7717_t:CDS:2 [Dentiscutata heterogama]